MKRSPIRTGFGLGLGLGLTLALLWALDGWSRPVTAAPAARSPSTISAVRYVAPGGTNSGNCSVPASACQTIQYALDRANDGDEIRVAAGTYTDLHLRALPYKIITQVVFFDKSVTIQGGYTTADWAQPDPMAHPTVLDAGGEGRVFYVDGEINATVAGLFITGGDAAGMGGGPLEEDVGGGVYATANEVTIRDSLVFSNQAEYGGGLYVGYGVATIRGNTITSNTARQGGGLYLDESDSALSGNTVAANSAEYGGGLFLSKSGATVHSNTVRSNSVITAGGGLLLWLSDDAVLSRNTVVSNTARSGGGLYLDESDPTLDGNVVVANVAAAEGGGLYLDRSAATLANNVVAHNRASTAGSGLYVLASSPHLAHTTIARNGSAAPPPEGDGCGVYVDKDGPHLSDVVLTNTILAGHQVGISVTADNRATLEATLWGTGAWANDSDAGGTGTIAIGTHNYWDDPDFVAPGAGDYHIGVISAALDRGGDAGVRNDMDGEPRPQGRGYDLGADETGLAVTKRAVPGQVAPGAQLNYTIRVTNTSVVSLTATITDVLPEHVTPAGTLTWPLVTIAPGHVHEETFAVTVEAGYVGVLTNVVEVTTDRGASGVYVETSLAGHHVYLPLVLRDAASAPARWR